MRKSDRGRESESESEREREREREGKRQMDRRRTEREAEKDEQKKIKYISYDVSSRQFAIDKYFCMTKNTLHTSSACFVITHDLEDRVGETICFSPYGGKRNSFSFDLTLYYI